MLKDFRKWSREDSELFDRLCWRGWLRYLFYAPLLSWYRADGRDDCARELMAHIENPAP